MFTVGADIITPTVHILAEYRYYRIVKVTTCNSTKAHNNLTGSAATSEKYRHREFTICVVNEYDVGIEALPTPTITLLLLKWTQEHK